MILTKAYIEELPVTGDNIFKVRVPLMEDNTGTPAIFEALLCQSSNDYNGYSLGDVVFVGFEDDKYNVAIILGKLFVNVPEENKAYTLTNELKVTNNATLPANTKLGDYKVSDLTTLFNGVMNANGNTVAEEVDLSQCVMWKDIEEREEPVFANKIMTMTGEEYDELTEIDDNTLYFLTTVPPSEETLEDTTEEE